MKINYDNAPAADNSNLDSTMDTLRMTTPIAPTPAFDLGRVQTALTCLALAAIMAMLCNNTQADELLDGFTLSSAQSAQGGENNNAAALGGLISMRPSAYYGTDFQLGAFGKSGPYDYSLLLDGTAVGYVPLSTSGINLYAKAGLAIIYSFTSNNTARILAPTYGAGIELKGKSNAVRLGFQHYDVGNTSLSPALSTNLLGISYLQMLK